MNINRDNYEEYFLLYADDELTDSEKVAVILFLKDNKDLEEEFRMIHHTISKPDADVQLTDKSFLFKKDIAVFINEKNYEEFFVLYHDNELSEKEKMETEEFLSLHKKLKNEFDLIGLARLTPESAVVFPDKKILYKKEKSDRVVPIIFWRMLASAVFIGFGLWITNLYFKKPSQQVNTIVHSIPLKNTSGETLIKEEKKNITIPDTSNIIAKNSTVIIKDKKENQQKVLSQNNNTTVAKNIITPKKIIEKNSLNKPNKKANEETIATKQEINDISKDEISSTNKIDSLKQLTQTIVEKNIEKDQPETYAKTDSYVVDANNRNENYVFYDVPAEKFKKTKVGGLFKKIKRVIERNNPLGRILSREDRQVASK